MIRTTDQGYSSNDEGQMIRVGKPIMVRDKVNTVKENGGASFRIRNDSK